MTTITLVIIINPRRRDQDLILIGHSSEDARKLAPIVANMEFEMNAALPQYRFHIGISSDDEK